MGFREISFLATEPGDNDIVKRFKSELRLLRDIRNTLCEALNLVEATNTIITSLAPRYLSREEMIARSSAVEAEMKDLNGLLLELASGNFLGRN